jgi:hypothetical protein
LQDVPMTEVAEFVGQHRLDLGGVSRASSVSKNTMRLARPRPVK